MDSELAGLEQKLAALLAEYHRLRAENASLTRELARAHEQSRQLSDKMAAATSRLDVLLQRLPQ
jgi:cell division protein ZapB